MFAPQDQGIIIAGILLQHSAINLRAMAYCPCAPGWRQSGRGRAGPWAGAIAFEHLLVLHERSGCSPGSLQQRSESQPQLEVIRLTRNESPQVFFGPCSRETFTGDEVRQHEPR